MFSGWSCARRKLLGRVWLLIQVASSITIDQNAPWDCASLSTSRSTFTVVGLSPGSSFQHWLRRFHSPSQHSCISGLFGRLPLITTDKIATNVCKSGKGFLVVRIFFAQDSLAHFSVKCTAVKNVPRWRPSRKPIRLKPPKSRDPVYLSGVALLPSIESCLRVSRWRSRFHYLAYLKQAMQFQSHITMLLSCRIQECWPIKRASAGMYRLIIRSLRLPLLDHRE